MDEMKDSPKPQTRIETVNALEVNKSTFLFIFVFRYLLGIWYLLMGILYKERIVTFLSVMHFVAAGCFTAAFLAPRLLDWMKGPVFLCDLAILFLGVDSFVAGLHKFSVAFSIGFFFLVFMGRYKIELRLKRRWNRILWSVVVVLTSVIFSANVLKTCHRFVLYSGSLQRASPAELPSNLQLDFEQMSIVTNGGSIKLSALFMKPTAEFGNRMDLTKPRLTVWILYGETQTMHDVVNSPLIPTMQKAYPNLQFFIHDYRGYGNSQGWPIEKGLSFDSWQVHQYLGFDMKVDMSRLIVFGHSLGGAVACDLASYYMREVPGLILSNTFLSMEKLVTDRHTSLLTPLLTETWNTARRLSEAAKDKQLRSTLFISSEKDTTVPAGHMKALYEIASKSNGSHKFLSCPEGTHNNWNNPGAVQKAMSELFESVAQQKPSPDME